MISTEIKNKKSSVVFKVHRAFRLKNNKALRHAYQKAQDIKCNLHIIYTRNTKDFESGWPCEQKITDFLDEGIEKFRKDLEEINKYQNFLDKKEKNINEENKIKKERVNINFKIIKSETSSQDFLDFCKKENVATVVSDMSPMRQHNAWQKYFVKSGIEIVTIDTHNMVPVTVVSDKEEFAARTIRPKIQSKMSEYIEKDFYINENIDFQIKNKITSIRRGFF